MNRIFSIILFLGWAALSSAQPFNVKKASKAVFTLKTFRADGTLLGSASGFYVGEQGQALSSFAPFRGASRAVVIDAQGKDWPVEAMLGASDTYDVAKFKVGAKRPDFLEVARQNAAEQSSVWVMPYRETKNVVQATVSRVEHFLGQNAYYTLDMPLPSAMNSCPLLNAEGQVVGIMQPAAAGTVEQSFAVSAAFADSLHITGLSINDRALRSTLIRKALPETLDQALVTLYVAGAALDSLSYAVLLDDFIAKYPSSPEGYSYRAQQKLQATDFAGAQKDMEQAISVAEKKDEAHYNYSRLVLQKELYMSQHPYEPWTLGLALSEAEKAHEINGQPIYLHQQAQVLFAQKKYAEAAGLYRRLSTTALRSAQLFYEASRCQEQLRDTTAQLALLDSALCVFSRPLLQDAAPYLLARARVRMDVGRYRDAVADLNDYEPLMRSRLTPSFYYLRYQAEVGGRLFKQALDDISQAIQMQPQYDLYQAEKASLEVRVGLYDDAIDTAKQCITLAPDHSDGYLFLGLAQCLKGLKADGLKNLQRARELGDAQADELIAKYAVE